MAFPVVEDIERSNSSATTSHSVDMPSGVQSGDLLLMFFAYGDSNAKPASLSGWTELSQPSQGELTHAVFYRLADGSEGSSVTVTTVDDAVMAASVYRISGAADPATQPPEQNNSGNFGDAPDPPSLTPAGGSDDYLWIAAVGWSREFSTVTMTDVPSGYTSGGSIDTGTSGGVSAGSGSAWLQQAASSEDPGVFTLSSNDQHRVHTVVVYPEDDGPDMQPVPLIEGVGETAGASGVILSAPMIEGVGAALDPNMGTSQVVLFAPLIEGVSEVGEVVFTGSFEQEVVPLPETDPTGPDLLVGQGLSGLKVPSGVYGFRLVLDTEFDLVGANDLTMRVRKPDSEIVILEAAKDATHDDRMYVIVPEGLFIETGFYQVQGRADFDDARLKTTMITVKVVQSLHA